MGPTRSLGLQRLGAPRLGWRALASLQPTQSTQVSQLGWRGLMNHTQGYFQTLTPTMGPVPASTLGVAISTHHLSYCSLNYIPTFILLE